MVKTHLPTVTAAMIEAKALVLFYQDELENLAYLARRDAQGASALGDDLGREMDCWENHSEKVKDRFRRRARKALEGEEQ